MGIVVSSSGNHGASAAAYAARADLPCVVLVTDDAPVEIQSFVLAYGAAAVRVPAEERWPLMRRMVESGFHPVSNLTPTHTGHPFGPEGYKTIFYEIFSQLGHRIPSAVFVPTGYAELLFRVWKGFKELRELGLTEKVSRMVSCEPAARAPLARALATGEPVARTEARSTAARSIAVTVSGYRGVVSIKGSSNSTCRRRNLAGIIRSGGRGRPARDSRAWGRFRGTSGLFGLLRRLEGLIPRRGTEYRGGFGLGRVTMDTQE